MDGLASESDFHKERLLLKGVSFSLAVLIVTSSRFFHGSMLGLGKFSLYELASGQGTLRYFLKPLSEGEEESNLINLKR